jgi:hypothetical protein
LLLLVYIDIYVSKAAAVGALLQTELEVSCETHDMGSSQNIRIQAADTVGHCFHSTQCKQPAFNDINCILQAGTSSA